MSEPESTEPPATASFEFPADPSEPENGAVRVLPARPRKQAPRAEPAPDTSRIENEKQRKTGPVPLDKWKEDCPKETFEEAWQWVLRHMGEQGWEPHHISIRVIRLTGGQIGQPEYLDPAVRGDQVLGDPAQGLSAGDALHNWIVRFYHSNPGTPNSYRVRITGPENDHIVDTKAVHWGSYAQMEARARLIQEATTAAGVAGAPLAPHAPAAAAGGYDAGYVRAKLEAKVEEYERALRENRAPRPVEPASGGGAQDFAERLRLERELAAANEKARAAEEARARDEKHAAERAELQRKLDEMQAAQARLELRRELDDLKARIASPPQPEVPVAQQVVQVLQTLGLIQTGPDGKPVPVGAGAPAVAPPPTPASASAEQLARAIVDHRAQADKAEGVLRSALGLEARTEIVQEETEEAKPEPGFLEKHVWPLAKGLIAHPEGPLAALGHIAQGSQLGEIASTVAKSVAVGRAAVAEAKMRVPPAHGGGGGGFTPPSA